MRRWRVLGPFLKILFCVRGSAEREMGLAFIDFMQTVSYVIQLNSLSWRREKGMEADWGQRQTRFSGFSLGHSLKDLFIGIWELGFWQTMLQISSTHKTLFYYFFSISVGVR